MGDESITEAIDRAVAVLIGMGITAVTGIVAYAIHKDRSVKVRINPTGVPGQEGEIMIGGPGASGEEEVVIDEPEPPKQIEQIPDIEAEYEDVVVGDKDAIVAEVIRRLTRNSQSIISEASTGIWKKMEPYKDSMKDSLKTWIQSNAGTLAEAMVPEDFGDSSWIPGKL